MAQFKAFVSGGDDQRQVRLDQWDRIKKPVDQKSGYLSRSINLTSPTRAGE